MGTESHIQEPNDGLARVRTHVLTAMHLGRLKPGDRVPLVRRMAVLTGLNRKTVHRAFLKLVHEGLLQTRQGSGTYLTDDSRGPLERPAPRRLLDAVQRCCDEARALGLTPDAFVRFVSQFVGEGLRGVSLAVVECNREQIGLIALDTARALGCQIRPVMLDELLARPLAVLGDARAIVTTDCHRQEVNAAAGSLGLPIYRIALESEFAQSLVQRAKQGPVLMVVRDAHFEGPWRRLMKQLKVPNEVAERFSFTEPKGLLAALRVMRIKPAVFVSPLVEHEIPAGIIDHTLRMPSSRYVEQASLERLKAMALFDLCGGIAGPPVNGVTAPVLTAFEGAAPGELPSVTH